MKNRKPHNVAELTDDELLKWVTKTHADTIKAINHFQKQIDEIQLFLKRKNDWYSSNVNLAMIALFEGIVEINKRVHKPYIKKISSKNKK